MFCLFFSKHAAMFFLENRLSSPISFWAAYRVLNHPVPNYYFYIHLKALGSERCKRWQRGSLQMSAEDLHNNAPTTHAPQAADFKKYNRNDCSAVAPRAVCACKWSRYNMIGVPATRASEYPVCNHSHTALFEPRCMVLIFTFWSAV